jgi:hypothetical protein
MTNYRIERASDADALARRASETIKKKKKKYK